MSPPNEVLMDDRERVRFVLPSGERIIANIPSGMSESEAKVYMLSKRPDLFSSQAKPVKGSPGAAQPLPGLAGAAQSGVAPALQSSLPTGNVPIAGAMMQPFGELAAGLLYDPEFRKQTAAYGAGSAAAVGGTAGLAGGVPAIGPAGIQGAKYVSDWINKSRTNQLIAYGIYHELRKHFGKTVHFIQNLPDIPDEE